MSLPLQTSTAQRSRHANPTSQINTKYADIPPFARHCLHFSLQMERAISALALLLGAALFGFSPVSLAEAEKHGSPASQATHPSLGFSFAAEKAAALLKRGRNGPAGFERRTGATEGMMGPGFAYRRSRGADAGPAENAKCTAEHWSSGREAWPRMVPLPSTAAKIFGSRALEAYGPRLTLLDGLRMEEEDGYASLLKQSSTALINSYARQGFPFSAWRVKTLLIQALVSQQAAASQARQFLLANIACSGT